MTNSREIPEDRWEQARRALIFYFTRRGLRDPEDLAQDTLAAVLRRSDFEFAKEEDFLRVCYAFADRVRKQGFRKAEQEFLAISDAQMPSHSEKAGRLRGAEVSVFLAQVQEAGKKSLRQEEWETITSSISSEENAPEEPVSDLLSNRLRVMRFRARNKLAELTGWTRTKKNPRAGDRGNKP